MMICFASGANILTKEMMSQNDKKIATIFKVLNFSFWYRILPQQIFFVEDVKKNIETSVEIFIHTKENIQKIKDSMPKVGQLNGATRVHEVVFEKDGKMMMKNIPTGSLFKPIRLKIGREIGRNRGETDNLTDNR